MKKYNWLYFVLFAVTGLLIFCCLRVPVNAAEGETFSYSVSVSGKRTNHSGNYVTFKVTFEGTFDYPVAGVAISSSGHTAAVYYYNGSSLRSAYLTCTSYVVIENTGVTNGDKLYTVGNTSDYIPITDTWHDFSSHDVESYYICTTSIPVFSSVDDAINYFQTGDTTQQINKDNYEKLTDDKPLFDDFTDLDFSDTDTNYLQDFRLEGFRSDYFVNAVWSSVHIPNKLQQWMDKGTIDMDDVAVMVMFTYANKNFPETDKYTKYYPRLLNATDLAATINVADFAPANDMYYLSGLSFIPVVEFTYYNSGMGTSMKPLNLMYYGSMNHIYFKQDGSANGAAFDAGDINGNKDGGFGLGNDDYNGIGGITGDITDALSKFSELLDSLYGSISRVAKFATVVFSWLPWWASLLIGAVVVVCFILRIAGR